MPTLAAIFPPTQAPERLNAVALAAEAAGLAQLWVWEDCFSESGIATTALYALLNGETVTAHGRYVHLDQVALDWPPAVVPPLLVGGIRPRTVSLAGELADGLIIPGGVSPDDVRTSVRQFHAGRTAAGRTTAGPADAGRTDAGRTDIVVFVSVPADGPVAATAATINAYARAGATHIAVNAAESDADLERFVGFLAHQVAPLVDDPAGLS